MIFRRLHEAKFFSWGCHCLNRGHAHLGIWGMAQLHEKATARGNDDELMKPAGAEGVEQ